jgi:hypothetical protein
MRHHAGDDQMVGAQSAQMLQQRRAAEAVGEMLLQHGFSDARRHVGVDVHAIGIGQEKACAGPVGNVLDMHQRQPLHAKGLKQFCRLQARLGTALQLHLAAGEVVVLDVDDDQGWFHG